MGRPRGSRHITTQEHATQLVDQAWEALPAPHRELLTEVGASQRLVVEQPLGTIVDKLLRSADAGGLTVDAQAKTDTAIAVWLQRLRLVVFNLRNQALVGLSPDAYAQALSQTAWHEWGHALSIVRCTPDDVRDGPRLLELAPTSVDNAIRCAGYRRDEYTYELVANVYAALVERRLERLRGRPKWLNQEIYDLVVRVTGWTERCEPSTGCPQDRP